MCSGPWESPQRPRLMGRGTSAGHLLEVYGLAFQLQAPLISRCPPPRWAFAAAARGGAGGETKAGDCPLQSRRSDVSPSILQGRA